MLAKSAYVNIMLFVQIIISNIFSTLIILIIAQEKLFFLLNGS